MVKPREAVFPKALIFIFWHLDSWFPWHSQAQIITNVITIE